MDITLESGPCLVEFTPSPGLSPDRFICPNLRTALERAVEVANPGPGSVWPDEFDRVRLSITCAQPNGSLADPQLITIGPPPDVYVAALNWSADYATPRFIQALTGEENPSVSELRTAMIDPSKLAMALQAISPQSVK
ncbi:hypothetical protein A5789_09185 [Nocardia sp. 852002-51101_SCH5132738]|uniref:hypothetical protein n=1 Tax=Nocardia sp. 852002-51101_SCH5132738 TaxID=1834095 RepID=UPI0007E9CE1B|nr:hypothetical protein [Nocardia sp. 852002-51101_SCH5132738]OBA44454.1 hypothetical protein A5789_09185 [Nocardia sp. 852002-51101_SCH5132738]